MKIYGLPDSIWSIHLYGKHRILTLPPRPRTRTPCRLIVIYTQLGAKLALQGLTGLISLNEMMWITFRIYYIGLFFIIFILTECAFCANGVLDVEYNHDGEKLIQISLRNTTGKDIRAVGSKLCYGFGLLIMRVDGTKLLIPSAIPRANSPPVNEFHVPNGGLITHEFALDQLNLGPGEYTLNCFWSSKQDADLTKADSSIQGLKLSISEGGNWDISTPKETVVQPLEFSSIKYDQGKTKSELSTPVVKTQLPVRQNLHKIEIKNGAQPKANETTAPPPSFFMLAGVILLAVYFFRRMKLDFF